MVPDGKTVPDGSKVFTPPEPFDFGGRTLYFTAGAGMRNYYWATGPDVYWVGIQSPNESGILQAFAHRR